MEQAHEQEIEEIIGQTACPKDFACHRSAFQVLCKAKDVGIESFLECLEEKPFACKFAVPFGSLYYCRCPLRVYISKKFGR
jgi:hypothetical protein